MHSHKINMENSEKIMPGPHGLKLHGILNKQSPQDIDALTNVDEDMEIERSGSKRRARDGDSEEEQVRSKRKYTFIERALTNLKEGSESAIHSNEATNNIITANGKQTMNNSTQPSNRTLSTAGSSKIIIIKPFGENSKSAITSPGKFSRAIRESVFKDIEIEEMRTNDRKGIIVIQYKHPSDIVNINLDEIKTLGEWQVKCYIPNSEKLGEVVIYLIDIKEDLKELMNEVRSDNNSKVIKLTRLNKRNPHGQGFIPSNTIRVTLETLELPNKIYIGHMSYAVRPYVYNPLQCFKCQRLGHTASSCRAKTRCLLCAENHSVSECDNATYKCANCRGNHKANSNQCINIQNACKIETRRANGESYDEAK